MKLVQAYGEKRSTGPAGSFESRTPTAPASSATSTQLEPLALLRLLLRHV